MNKSPEMFCFDKCLKFEGYWMMGSTNSEVHISTLNKSEEINEILFLRKCSWNDPETITKKSNRYT